MYLKLQYFLHTKTAFRNTLLPKVEKSLDKHCLWQIPRPLGRDIGSCPPLSTMSPLFPLAAQPVLFQFKLLNKQKFPRNFTFDFHIHDSAFPSASKMFPISPNSPESYLEILCPAGCPGISAVQELFDQKNSFDCTCYTKNQEHFVPR